MSKKVSLYGLADDETGSKSLNAKRGPKLSTVAGCQDGCVCQEIFHFQSGVRPDFEDERRRKIRSTAGWSHLARQKCRDERMSQLNCRKRSSTQGSAKTPVGFDDARPEENSDQEKGVYQGGNDCEGKKPNFDGEDEDSPKMKKAKISPVVTGVGNPEEDRAKKAVLSRKRYSNEFKLEVIAKLDAPGMTASAVAKIYDLPLNTMLHWKKDRVNINNAHIKLHRQNAKANPSHALWRVEKAITDFYDRNARQNVRRRVNVTPSVVCDKGLLIKQLLLDQHSQTPFLTEKEKVALEKFNATMTWGKKFCLRRNWKSRGVCKQKGANDTVETETWRIELDKLRNVVSSYPPQNVFILSKTVLYYKLLPGLSSIQLIRSNYTKILSPAQDASNRVTIYICTNELGDKRILPTIIGQPKNPDCFIGRNHEALPYLSQNIAWSSNQTLEGWWNLFLKQVREFQTDKALLIVDLDCGAHGLSLRDPEGQVAIFTLPPSLLSAHQPLGSRVLTTVKCNYRSAMLREVIKVLPQRHLRQKAAKGAKLKLSRSGIAHGCAPHLADLARILKSVWDEIKPETFRLYWEQAGLRQNAKQNESMVTEIDASTKHILNEISCLVAEKENEDAHCHKDATNGNDKSDFDTSIDEMLQSLKTVDSHEHVRQEDALYQTVKEWITIEESEGMQQHFGEEAQNELDMENILSLKTIAGKVDESVDEVGFPMGEDCPPPLDDNDITKMASKILSLSEKLACASEEYSDASLMLQGAFEAIFNASNSVNLVKHDPQKGT